LKRKKKDQYELAKELSRSVILNQGARGPLRGLIKLPSELKDYLKLLYIRQNKF